MKFASSLLAAALLVQTVSAHYIWTTLVTETTTTTKAIRQPRNNSPVENVTSKDITCNASPSPASETVSVRAGSEITFLLDNTLYHTGPGAIYLGKAPGDVSQWDGSGAAWFKIADFGATYNPFKFVDDGASKLSAKIPASIPSGQYLARVEHIGLHVAGSPQFYVSCAQIAVTGGGSANPAKVSIPGYIGANDQSIKLNIYNPVPTQYTTPGPRVFA